MNTVNETGKYAGRYLYRTHEVRGGAIGNDGNSLRNDGGSGGAVSMVDLKTGIAREVVGRADWEALDGIVWTPWQTVLFAEEAGTTARPDPDAPKAQAGLVYELKLDKSKPMSAESVTVRPMLGALAHEGIETDAAEWVALDMAQAQIRANVAARAVRATEFCRPRTSSASTAPCMWR